MQSKAPQALTSREIILSASAILFCEYGYAGVSMRKIAESCEMKAGSLYHHFASKDQILTEVLNIGIQKVHAAVAAALSDRPEGALAIDCLRGAILGHLHALLENSSFTSANVRIFRQVPADVQHSNSRGAARLRGVVGWVFARSCKRQASCASDVDPRSLRLMLIGALNATLEWFDPANSETSATLLIVTRTCWPMAL